MLEKKREYEKQQGIKSKIAYYDNLAQKAMDSEKAKYERKKQIAINKYIKGFDRRTRKLLDIETQKNKLRTVSKKAIKTTEKIKLRLDKAKNKNTKKAPTNAKIKQLAYIEFQKYAKLSRCDTEGYVILADNGKRVHWTKAQGGHGFSKHNYSMLAFEIINCRPISPFTNKRQGENTGYIWMKNVLNTRQIEWLENIAQGEKKVYDRSYYQGQYEHYKGLNEDILHNNPHYELSKNTKRE